MATAVGQDTSKLCAELLQFTTGVDTLGTPDEVLDGLHKVAFQACQLSVLGALLLPLRWGDLARP